MEALVAIGLAGNIVQFVDFSLKIVSKTSELYSGRHPQDHDELAIVQRDLEMLLDRVVTQYVVNDMECADLVKACRDIGGQLVGALSEVQKGYKGRNALIRAGLSFYGALRNSWGREKIEGLQQRLERIRDQLGFRLVLILSERSAASIKSQEEQKAMVEEAAARLSRLNLEETVEFAKLDTVSKEIIRLLESGRHDLAQISPQIKAEFAGLHRETLEEIRGVRQDLLGVREDVITMKRKFDDMSQFHPHFNHGQDERPWSERLLETFRFRAMDDRVESIKKTHERTFNWIIDGISVARSRSWDLLDVVADEDPCGLRRWLELREGIFWITGKPGSGKSTLMKYLSESSTCVALLSAWSGSDKLLIASFFAWRAGFSKMEKTRMGFMQSLVYQLMEQHPSLINALIPVTEQEQGVFRNASQLLEEVWSYAEMRRFLNRFVKLKDLKVCIFLDGLDEFDEPYLQLGQFLADLAKVNWIKILVAGRDVLEFDEAFECTKIHLHEWTRPDIEIFVQDALLQESTVSRGARVERPAFDGLVSELLDKAEGVFIWVKTAIATLLEGLRESDTIQELRERLEKLPPNLFDLYEKILKSLPKWHLEQATQYFAYLESAESLGIDQGQGPIFALAQYYDRDDPSWILKQHNLKSDDLSTVVRKVTQRVRSRCSHFVCMQYDGPGEGLYCLDLDPECERKYMYMHRTAFDFLRSPQAQAVLSPVAEDQQEAIRRALTMAEICVLTMRSATFDETGPMRLESLFMHLLILRFRGVIPDAHDQLKACLQEWLSGQSKEEFHVELLHELTLRRDSWPIWMRNNQLLNAFELAGVDFAFDCMYAQLGQLEYVSEALERNPIKEKMELTIELITCTFLSGFFPDHRIPQSRLQFHGMRAEKTHVHHYICEPEVLRVLWHRILQILRRVWEDEFEYVGFLLGNAESLLEAGADPNEFCDPIEDEERLSALAVIEQVSCWIKDTEEDAIGADVLEWTDGHTMICWKEYCVYVKSLCSSMISSMERRGAKVIVEELPGNRHSELYQMQFPPLKLGDSRSEVGSSDPSD